MSITNQHLLKNNSLETKQITKDTLGEGKLIEGDTLNGLAKIDDDVVDVGVTSPPYNKQEKQKGWLVKNVVYDTYKDAVPEPEYQQNQVNVLNEIHRVTAPGGSFFYNHKIRWDRGNMYHPMDWLRKTEWTVKQEIIWDRVIAANIRGWRFWQVEERIYWLYKPIGNSLIGKELKSCDAKLTSIWRGVPEDGRKNPHPAPFSALVACTGDYIHLGDRDARHCIRPLHRQRHDCGRSKTFRAYIHRHRQKRNIPENDARQIESGYQ